MDDERFSIYIALDGPFLDGLIGSAGLLRFDWPERTFVIQHYDGISAAHNVSLSPNGEFAVLGNFSQQIAIVDISHRDALPIVKRQSTLYFEECGYRLRSNTHHLWYPDNRHFIGAVGDHLYIFDMNDLTSPENLGPHYLENAHELRWDSSQRYILIGDLGPEHNDVRQIAVFDLHETDIRNRSRKIKVHNNCWHCAVHPQEQKGYALTYSFAVDQEDYVDWAPALVREYIYEIDLPTARITRSWSSGAEFPVHLNSDVDVTRDGVLYIASGGSHCVVEIPLADFDKSRVLYCIPPFLCRIRGWRQSFKNLLGAFSRRPAYHTDYIFQALQITGGRLADGIYAARVSPGGNYLITGHRGYNVLTVYDRKSFKELYRCLLPFRRDVYSSSPHYRLGRRGYHLGMHHSEIVAR